MLYFFLSQADPDDDPYTKKFFQDLESEVRVFAGAGNDEVVGFNGRRRTIAETERALAQARTFVGLVTPRYFLSDWCGREWSAFASRVAQAERATGAQIPVLLPVMWLPPRMLPEAVSKRQLPQFGPGRNVEREGVRQLLRLRSKQDTYLEFLSDLAEHIVSMGLGSALAPSRTVHLSETPNAFALQRVPVASAEADVLSMVREAFSAAGRPLPGWERPILQHDPVRSDGGRVWVSAAPERALDDLDRLRRELPFGQVGYFVHDGDLPAAAENAIDRLRVGGSPVVTISGRALRAALADGRVKEFLDEIERTYGTRDNLFDTKNALTNERFLFGREIMLNTIGGRIRRGEHVLITGLRKVGKTSLLNILRQHLVDQAVCMVDLQRFDRRHEDWPETLFRLMLEAFDRWGRNERRDDWPFRSEPQRTVTELERALDARFAHPAAPDRLVVIMDEIERVFPLAGEDEPAHRWVRASGALRLLSQGERRRVAVIGADLRPLATRENVLGAAGTNPFFGLLQEEPVPLLDRTAVGDMVRSLASRMGVGAVDPEFVERLFALTGGHPSLARTIAGPAYVGRAHADRLTGSDLARALEQLEDTDALGYFLRNNLWHLMTAAERTVAVELAGHRPETPLRPRVRRQAIAALRAQGLVDGDRIAIGLFDEWIRDGEVDR